MIYHVFANRSNAGDWLSARGIQQLLAPEEVVELLCDEPFVPETLEKLNHATSSDFVIIGGGGLFMDYFVSFWEGFRTVSRRVPFAIWGVGYCDMKREACRPPLRLIEEIVNRAQVCVVRDELTREHLKSCKLPDPVPCPTVVALERTLVRTEPHLLHVDHFDNVGEHIFDFMTTVGQEFAQRTNRKFRRTNNLLPKSTLSELERVVSLYASADLVLTSRLHGCIIALALGKPVLAVSGDNKVESFMHAAGLSDWVLDLDHVSQLRERLDQLAHQPLPARFVNGACERNFEVAAQLKKILPEYSPTMHP